MACHSAVSVKAREAISRTEPPLTRNQMTYYGTKSYLHQDLLQDQNPKSLFQFPSPSVHSDAGQVLH